MNTQSLKRMLPAYMNEKAMSECRAEGRRYVSYPMSQQWQIRKVRNDFKNHGQTVG